MTTMSTSSSTSYYSGSESGKDADDQLIQKHVTNFHQDSRLATWINSSSVLTKSNLFLHDTLIRAQMVVNKSAVSGQEFGKSGEESNGGSKNRLITCPVQYLDDTDPFGCNTTLEPQRPLLYSFVPEIPLANQLPGLHKFLNAPHKIEDCTLQIYKIPGKGSSKNPPNYENLKRQNFIQHGCQNGGNLNVGEFWTYLDLESTLQEQLEELEQLEDECGSLVLRTQLNVRVHQIIEKLLNSSGRQLRRALFALKQLFQDDKDLVHDFVQNDGLSCLIKVGMEADQNYQNYILRALSQIMLYVDGMDGIIKHNETLQWLCALLSSKFRLVIKTSLKLLLVFLEYKETNAILFLKSLTAVDPLNPWKSLVELMDDKECTNDYELLIHTITIINKTLANLPARSKDNSHESLLISNLRALENLGLPMIVQRYACRKSCGDIDFTDQLTQFQTLTKLSELSSLVSDDCRRSENGEEIERSSSALNRFKQRASEWDISPSYAHSGRYNSVNDCGGNGMDVSSSSSSSYGSCSSNRNRGTPQQAYLQPPTSINTSTGMTSSMTSSRSGQSSSPSGSSLFSWRDKFKRSDLMTPKPERAEPSVGPPPEGRRGSSHSYAPTPISSEQLMNSCSSAAMSYLKQIPQGKPSSGPTPSSARSKFRALEAVIASSPPTNGNVAKQLIHSNPLGSHQLISPNENHRQSDVNRLQRNDSTRIESKQNMQQRKEEFLLGTPINGSSQSSPNQSFRKTLANQSASTFDRRHQTIDQSQSLARLRGQTSNQSVKNQMFDNLYRTPPRVITNKINGHNNGDSNNSPPKILHHRDAQPPLPNKSSPLHLNPESSNPSHNFTNQSKSMPVTQHNRNPYDIHTNQQQSCQQQESQKQSPRQQNISKQEYQQGKNQQSYQQINSKHENSEKNKQQTSSTNSPKIEAARPYVPEICPETIPANYQSIPAKSESQQEWEKLLASLKRPLRVLDLDFGDLTADDDVNVFAPEVGSGGINPPPPPPLRGSIPPPPPPLGGINTRGSPIPAPPPPSCLKPPGLTKNFSASSLNLSMDSSISARKTLRLFWKEIKPANQIAAQSKPQRLGQSSQGMTTIWSKIRPITLDYDLLEYLFETRAKEIPKKKEDGGNKKGYITVLDSKRSNAINIGMTKLPPARAIKAAVMKMDNSIMNRECIEKILTTMIPTEEEKQKIIEAQIANPELPLGTAEQFLLMLSSISELEARLKLWAFKHDYEGLERDIAEPMMDLKVGLKELEENKTMAYVLSVILAVGNFLNGTECKGFNVDYLAKIPEVKDTVSKQSLLHHLCQFVMERFLDSSDLYSELGSLVRSSRVDFDDLSANLDKVETLCKESWDNLRAVIKHETGPVLKIRMSEFISDCAQRIMVLKIVHRRLINRYHKTSKYYGFTATTSRDMKITTFCRLFTDFALEYKTARERLVENLKKKQRHKERNMTRGKMITENFKPPLGEERRENDLKSNHKQASSTNGNSSNFYSNNPLANKKHPYNSPANLPSTMPSKQNIQISNSLEESKETADRTLKNLLLSTGNPFNRRSNIPAKNCAPTRLKSGFPAKSMHNLSSLQNSGGNERELENGSNRNSTTFLKSPNKTRTPSLQRRSAPQPKLRNGSENGKVYTDEDMISTLAITPCSPAQRRNGKERKPFFLKGFL